MDNNNLFSPYQFGSISGQSTTLQLLNVLDKWTKAFNEGHSVDTMHMDFQKAFNKVPHIRLISKIKNYGVHQSLLNWIHVYLQNRTQYVTIKNKTSTYTTQLYPEFPRALFYGLFYLSCTSMTYPNLLIAISTCLQMTQNCLK